MRILLIDNYDSFTFNIVHLLRDCGVSAEDIDVRRNDDITVAELEGYSAVLSSPGPGLPEDSGALLPCVRFCVERKSPYFGICLGHQALGIALGGTLTRLKSVQHGVQHLCAREVENPLLDGLPDSFLVGRYHSWIVDRGSLSGEAQVLALSPVDGAVQILAARDAPAYGVQFHPESIMSEVAGPQLMRNFLRLAELASFPSQALLSHA